MTNKIKEIIKDIKEIYYFKPLLDYITNLQEELKKTKLENKVLKEQMVAMVQPNYVYGIELRGEDNEKDN